MDIEGYKVQSEMVTEGFDRLITGREERKESRGCSPEPEFEPEFCGLWFQTSGFSFIYKAKYTDYSGQLDD
ncbi:hypothetical protein ACET3Z_028915 [Daucus carota]